MCYGYDDRDLRSAASNAHRACRAIARHLRREGWKIRDIAAEIGVEYESARIWCEGLPRGGE